MGKQTELTTPNDGFDAAFERICGELGIKTQVELAAALGIRQSSISDAKRRGAIPAEWQLTLFEQYGLMPVWVRSGFGPRRLGEGPVMTAKRDNLEQVQLLFNDFMRTASAAMGIGAAAQQ